MAINITSRIRNAMLGLSVVLCLLFTGLIFLLVYIIEDRVFVNQIKLEQADFERTIATGEQLKIAAWQPANSNIQRVDSAEQLPTSLPEKVLARVTEQVGVHEYFDDQHAIFINHLLRADTNSPYFLVYRVQNQLAVRGSKLTLFILIGAFSITLLFLAVVVAQRLTKSTLVPITRLSSALQSNDLDEAVIKLAQEFSEDEISVLTNELAKALERMQATSRREHEFNRGISHELRSPIQVAQSATELLLVSNNSDRNISAKPLLRLQRAIAEMNEISEAFLWLASDRSVNRDEQCSGSELRDIVTSLRNTLTNTPINLLTDSLPSKHCYPLPKQVVTVVLRNLLRNAIMHGDGTSIDIKLSKQLIQVSNAANEKTSSARSFGLGLSIVERICERFDCRLEHGFEHEGRYSTTIWLP